MENLVKLLQSNTASAGNWSLDWNDHRTNYISAKEILQRFYHEDELSGIDFSKDIFELHWYKDTPVGSYKLVANSISGIIEKVHEVIENT